MVSKTILEIRLVGESLIRKNGRYKITHIRSEEVVDKRYFDPNNYIGRVPKKKKEE